MEATCLPAPSQWPSIHSSGTSPTTPLSPYDPSASESDTRLRQRLLLASRTVLVEAGPAASSSSAGRTPQAALKIHDDLNKKLCDLDEGNLELVNSPDDKTIIRGIKTLERGAVLFELNSPAAAARFRSYCSEFNLLTSYLGRAAHVKNKAYNLVFRFVPCQGNFDPYDLDHIATIETENGLAAGSITSASWLKKPERRSPNQHVASLKITCSSPEAANHLLRERIYVAGHVITVRKDLREPIRCNKCQLYGHIRSACISDEKCAFCASNDHTSADCRPRCPLPRKLNALFPHGRTLDVGLRAPETLQYTTPTTAPAVVVSSGSLLWCQGSLGGFRCPVVLFSSHVRS